jgi:hypothetical protein
MDPVTLERQTCPECAEEVASPPKIDVATS